ncbi:hypothetical protein [Streptomyces prunicolor]|uniref:hypothetical protein n=1 Tax=Streptomyces prunicolor TaxID=67348 RepID=UPI001319E6B2|nr:hypothetical protein [Streptomyces prunicolor]
MVKAAVAEEVPVDVTAAVGGVLDDHATLFAPVAAAGAAEQRSLQLVMMHTPPLTSGVAGIGDHLDMIEEVLRNQGSVTALVLLFLMSDPAAVVVVAQDAV